MPIFYLVALIISLMLSFLAETSGQVIDEQQKAQEIAQDFNKSKHKAKEKHGMIVHVSFEMRNEPLVIENISDYSGSYKSDNGGLISLAVRAKGEIDAEGYEASENEQPRRFRLRNARIKDALLMATKVFDDGSTENFEAAFLNQTLKDNVSGKVTTIFGLGVKYASPKTDLQTGFVIDKSFYRKQAN